MIQNFVHYTPQRNKLNITAFGVENLSSAPCITFVHGFKGFKDWGFGPYIGNYFAEKGFFVLSFNFSHNGVGDSLTEFTELDKFAENTFSLEIEELAEIVTLYQSSFFGETGNKKIFLLGHSRGGAIALLTASKLNEVSAVAIWSSVSTFDRYSKRQKEQWRKKGYFDVFNTRTKQAMRLNVSLIDDLEKHKNDSLNIENAIRTLNRSLFIAHADQDLAVPIKEAEQIYEWSDKRITEFYKIIGAGHTFNCKHPFDGSNRKFDLLLEKTFNFFSTC
ncbi:MAG: alpha/beta hydrolase [Ignavibacteriaceae bacterium]|jgi:dienelactone hydrolase|nr:alpha/beta hydrolase [Ignavibacteriaceae bacterium]